MRRILKMLKPYRGSLILAIFFSAAYSVMEILIPVYTKYILSEGIISKNMDKILYYGGVMLLMTLGGVVMSLLNTYFSTKTSVNYAMRIRNEVFTKVSYLSQCDVDKIGVSSMMTRTTNDVRQVHDVILSALKSILPVPIMLVGGFYMAYSVNPRLLKLIFLILPILLLIVIVVLIFIMPMFSKIQKLLDQLNFVLRGKIGGIRVVRAFNKSDYEDERFDDKNKQLTGLSLKATRIMSSLLPIITVALYSLICYIIYMCVNDAATPGMSKEAILATIPNMYMFLAYFTLIVGAMGMVITIVVTFPKASVSAKRLNEILDAVPEIADPENPVVPDENIKGTVEFKNVSFKYKEEPEGKKRKIQSEFAKKLLAKAAKSAAKKKQKEAIKKEEKKTEELPPVVIPPEAEKKAEKDEEEAKKEKNAAIHNISFSSKGGEVTAIIGITGCGKSTLVNLIPRLYDVTEGQILVDGTDIRDMSISELHKRIAYVPQQSYLFSGTVRDNIKFGNPDATDDEVWRAIEIAQAKTFVSNLPEGIDSFVSQAGKNFSGGQKQRLAIARAIIKNAEICIFDDSFSALDLATDARLRASLRENLPDTNIIIVAQRVGTVINADRIIVMDKGEAVGRGTHKELLESCEVYKSIVASQMSEDEEEAAV